MRTMASPDGKKTKDEANYRPATTSETCHNCASMNDDGTCDKVQGIVTKANTCDLWSKP